MCIAVGNVSFDDWDILMSSFGCSSFLPASSLPRLAMTSLAFMLDCVPEPVCQTTSGKWSFSLPDATSSQACSMAASFSSVIFSGLSAWLALRGGLLQDAEGMGDLARHRLKAHADREILVAALGLRGPVFVGRDLDLAHGIMLDAVFHRVCILQL